MQRSEITKALRKLGVGKISLNVAVNILMDDCPFCAIILLG